MAYSQDEADLLRQLAELKTAIEHFFDACERHDARWNTHPEISEAYQRLCELAYSATKPRTRTKRPPR